MAKRLIKQISFSDHERDIYDYLVEQPNASALLKKLAYAYMHGLIKLPDADEPIVEKKVKAKKKSPQKPPTAKMKKYEEKTEEEIRKDYYDQLPF